MPSKQLPFKASVTRAISPLASAAAIVPGVTACKAAAQRLSGSVGASGRNHRTERHQQDDDGRDQPGDLADPRLRLLEGEEQIAAHLNLKRGVLPQLRSEVLESLKVRGFEIGKDWVLDADQGHATIG